MTTPQPDNRAPASTEPTPYKHPYPLEFIGILQEYATHQIMEWLRDSNAPSTVVDLFNHAISLETYYWMAKESAAKDDKNNAFKFFGIEEIVPETITAITELGGVWHGVYSISVSRASKTEAAHD